MKNTEVILLVELVRLLRRKGQPILNQVVNWTVNQCVSQFSLQL